MAQNTPGVCKIMRVVKRGIFFNPHFISPRPLKFSFLHVGRLSIATLFPYLTLPLLNPLPLLYNTTYPYLPPSCRHFNTSPVETCTRVFCVSLLSIFVFSSPSTLFVHIAVIFSCVTVRCWLDFIKHKLSKYIVHC